MQPCKASGSTKEPLLQVFGYYRSGAESEATVKENREAFSRVKLLPRMLVDVSKRETTTELMGKCLS